MNKKMKRYEEGGEVEFETKMGRNENIGDDVRERAMAAMAARESSAKEAEPVKPKAESKPKAKAAASKPKSEGTFSKSKSAFDKSDSAFNKSDGTFNKSDGAFSKSKGAFKKMASGGSVSSASKRADGCAVKGKTKGRMV